MEPITVTSKDIFTEKEIIILNNLNTSQIISLHPNLVELAINNGNSLSDILSLLCISPTNISARNSIKLFAQGKNITLPAYVYKNNKSLPLTKEIVLDRLIKSDRHYGSSLREWIIKFDILPYTCFTEKCPNKTPIFLGRAFKYDLDHINGDNTDNRISNLRFLCPMCHSQTHTYRGKNANKTKNKSFKNCLQCNNLTKNHFMCDVCLVSNPNVVEDYKKSIIIPTIAEIINEVETTSISFVARKYMLDRKKVSFIIKNPNYYKDYKNERQKYSYPQKEEVISLLKVGKKITEIAIMYNIPIKTFRKYLEKNKITVKKYKM